MATPAKTEDNANLRTEVLKGGRRLFFRQLAGVGVSLIGVLVLTRQIGPSSYGVYASAFGLTFFAQTMGEWSLDIYMVRRSGGLPLFVCHQVFTLLILLAFITTAVMLSLTSTIASLVHLPDFSPVAFVMFASIPLMHLQQVPLSRRERGFDYGTIGVVEVLAQLTFFVVALPLAVAGKGVWAPVGGWWAQQLVLLAGFWIRDDYHPRFSWDFTLIKEIMTYGALTTCGTFVYSLRTLVIPLLAASTLGAAAVGFLSLAIRLVEQLAFARQVMARLSFALVGRVVSDRQRLRRALTQGTELQLLAVGVPLTLFALLAGPLVPLIFGQNWTPVATLVPLLAPAWLAIAAFSLQTAVLATRARPWELIVSQGTSTVLLWAGSLVLLSPYGVEGYAYAELIAMASWLVGDVLMARSFPRPRYGVAIGWWIALSATALAPVVTWWLLLCLPVGFLLPPSLRELRPMLTILLSRSGLGSGAVT